MEKIITEEHKTPNTLIFTLSEPNAINAIRKLHDNKIINICEWLGIDKGQGVITYDYRVIANYDIQNNISLPCPPEIYNKVYKNIYRFIDCFTRVENIPTYEYVHRFDMFLNFYYGLFKRKNINLLIFGDCPHFGVDSIAKDLADAMGIKTILFQHAFELNYFFAFTDIDDIGLFDTLPNNNDFKIELEEKSEKDIYYMKDHRIIYPTVYTGGESLSSLARRIWNNRKKLYTKGIPKMLAKIEHFVFKRRVDFEYKVNCQENIYNMAIDLKCKFVYFPLHLQPEQSTSLYGREFCDQVLAIERLRQMLPDDWKIYVKENPKQSYYMRDELFFRRLKLIPNTFYVSREVNTYDLIKNSQFVATITGTAGWEAISGGKCALVFGLAWYRKLPGVFEYSSGVTVEEIINYKINHQELVDAYNKLISKAYVGVLECGPEIAIENYSDEKNNKYLYSALANIVDKIMSKGEENFHEAVNC